MSEIDPTANPLDQAPGWPARRRAIWRFLGWLALAVAAVVIGGVIAALLIGKPKINTAAPIPPAVFIIGEVVQALLTVMIPTAIMIRIGREPATRFGWGRSDRLRNLAIGLASGFGLMTALLIVIALMGGYSFGHVVLGAGPALGYGLVYACGFSLTAISEEGLLRGYGFVQLSRAFSFWPVAIVTSLIFAALHLANAHETPVGLSQVVLVGLVLAYSFRRSGGLWFAWGFHAAWDYAQSFVYGVPDSGVILKGALMQPSFHGPVWLTGGATGPEASLLCPLTIIALAAIARLALRPPPDAA